MGQHAWMWILWPSFLMAAVTSGAVFAFVDPLDIAFFGYLRGDRQDIYAGGFFLFWAMAALSSALTWRLAPHGRRVDEFGDTVEDD